MTSPSPAFSAEHWGRLSPLLDGLLDLPEDQRPARLAELRLQDPALADELQALLSGGARAASESFLAGAVPLQPADTPTTSLAGQHLGPYVLEEPLGQGGGGSVWRARREDGRFEGAVAIKLLHLSLLGRAGAERFRREGHILARLKHPHIASLLDAGVTPAASPTWCWNWCRANASIAIAMH
jgi:serine/threonine protein kinase